MKKLWSMLIVMSLLMIVPIYNHVHAASFLCGSTPIPCGAAPGQGLTLFNSQTVSAANTAVTITIAAMTGARTHVYSLDAFCSAGTSNLTITDGGTTIWSTPATEVPVTRDRISWPTGLTSATNSAIVITLAACGAANTGTLDVQADRY